MVDPIFYALLIPPGIALVIALVVFMRARRISGKPAVRFSLLIIAGGIIIPIVLFAGFVMLYYSGKGH